jgi:hypothetical protein
VATVAPTTGLATGVTSGVSDITASFGGQIATVTLTVTPAILTSIAVTPVAPSIPIDGIQQFTATATYDDGSTGDVTASASWTSATPAVATVAPTTGLATGVTSGVSDITADFGGQTATVTLTVNPATLTLLQVTPASASIAVGGTRQYTARATYSDSSILIVTPSSSWTSADTAVATISASGLATGVTTGSSDITADFGGMTSTAAILNVDDTLIATIIPSASCTVDSGPTIPTVTTSNPTSGNPFASTSTAGVANNGKLITATFSLAMDPATIESATAPLTFTIFEAVNLNLVAGTVTMDATNKIATFTTDAALLPDMDYTAAITTDAMSAGAVAIACPYEWDFTTVTPPAIGLGPVNLGAAATFGSASTAGIVNVGATTVNGDVVLDPNATCNGVTVGSAGLIGQCNGIAPTIKGEVISPLYPDAGVTSGNIVADLRAAYIALSPAQMSTGVTTLGDGTTMGAGAGTAPVTNDNLFFPGIYKTTAGGMLITGDLTLDGQGDSNAVFVFQSDSSIKTAATGAGDPHTRILLTNGAKASNVFWWVGSNAATLGSYSIFQGNILSYSDITMESGASSCGRLFAGASTDGAFVFGDNIVSVPGNVNAPAGCE